MKHFLLTIVVVISTLHFCVSQSVGVGTTIPHSSARLDVQATDKGMLVPRIALTAANVAAPVTSPADALLLYNTATSGVGADAVAPGFYYWSTTSGRWIAMRNNDATNATPGRGNWGDCSVKNVSGYDPVVADDGTNLDGFGNSVAISGNWAIIGARGDDTGLMQSHGSAYFYFFDGTRWIQRQKVGASDASTSDGFGSDVSISGNYAIVGASGDDVGPMPDQGSAYIFFYNGTTWSQVQQIFHPSGAFGDNFGASVCMKGTQVIIGAPNDAVGAIGAQGSAQVFVFNGSSWIFQAQLLASDGAAADHFGRSVGIENSRAVVGAPDDDVSFANQGSAYIFFYNGTAWTQQQRFSSTNFPAADDNYGSSVAVSGNVCIIGCPNNAGSDVGFVDVWTFGPVIWVKSQTILPPAGTTQQYIGRSVAIDNDLFIIAAPGMEVNGVEFAGRVFIYKNYSGIWRLYEQLGDPAAGPVDAFGSSLALDNGRFVAGSGLPPDQQQRGIAIFGKIEQ